MSIDKTFADLIAAINLNTELNRAVIEKMQSLILVMSKYSYETHVSLAFDSPAPPGVDSDDSAAIEKALAPAALVPTVGTESLAEIKRAAQASSVQSVAAAPAAVASADETAANDCSRESAALAVMTLAKTNGRPAALKVLSNFDGVQNLNDIDPRHYASVIAACNAALKAGA